MANRFIWMEPAPWDGENRTPEGYSEYLLRDAIRTCLEEGRERSEIIQAVIDELNFQEQAK